MNGVAASKLAFETLTMADAGANARTVSVVMVVYFPGEPLKRSLECALADPMVSELVVVDNGCSADEAAHLRALAAADGRVVVVSGQGNVGFARASNLGARKATGERLVFLNPDAFLQANCVAELVQAIEGRPIPSLVGARVLNADRTEQRGGRRGDITPLSAMLSLSTLARRVPGLRRFEVHWETDPSPEHVIEAPTISGACFCMRREDFEAVSGFDEGYFLHVEDVDLCWRVRQQGGVVLFHPDAEVIHLGGTSQTSPLKVEFHKAIGLARFFRKRADGAGQHVAAWLLWPVIMGAALLRPMMWRLRSRAG